MYQLSVVLSKKEQYQNLHFGQYGVWEALEILDQLIDSVSFTITITHYKTVK